MKIEHNIFRKLRVLSTNNWQLLFCFLHTNHIKVFYYITKVINKKIGVYIMNLNINNETEQGTHKHSPLKHMLHMIICCGLPVVIILSLPFIAKLSPGVATLLGFIAPFICPIMMGGMLFMMFGGKKKSSCCDEDKKEI
jgi:hypothetical protein